MYVARRAPGELIRGARILIERFDEVQGVGGEGVCSERNISVRIQYLCAKGVKEGVQTDVAFESRSKSQSAWNTEFRADSLAAAVQAVVSAGAERHARLRPAVFEIVHGRRNPEVGKREVGFRPRTQRGLIGDLRDAAVLERNVLIYFRMIDRMAMEFRGGPGEHKEIVALAGRYFRRSVSVDSLDGNVIDNNFCVVFL